MAAFQTYEPVKDAEDLVLEINVPRVQLVDDHGNPLFDEDGNAVFDRGEGEALRLGGDDGHSFPFQARTGSEEAALGAHPLLRKSKQEAKGGGKRSVKAKQDNGGEG